MKYTLQNPQQPIYKLIFWNTSFWKQTAYSKFELKMDLQLMGLLFPLQASVGCCQQRVGHGTAQCEGCSDGVRPLMYIYPVSPLFLSQPFLIFVVLLWTLRVSFPPGIPRVNTTFLAHTKTPILYCISSLRICGISNCEMDLKIWIKKLKFIRKFTPRLVFKCHLEYFIFSSYHLGNQ